MHDGDADWYGSGREYQKEVGIDDLDNRPQMRTDDPNLHLDSGIANYIYDFDDSEVGKGVISPQADVYLPTWQVSKKCTTKGAPQFGRRHSHFNSSSPSTVCRLLLSLSDRSSTKTLLLNQKPLYPASSIMK